MAVQYRKRLRKINVTSYSNTELFLRIFLVVSARCFDEFAFYDEAHVFSSDIYRVAQNHNLRLIFVCLNNIAFNVNNSYYF